MRNRFESICRAIVLLFSCDNEQAIKICLATRSGRLAKSKNIAMLQEGLAHNLESIVGELKHKKPYMKKANAIRIDDIFNVTRIVNLENIQKKLDDDKKMIKEGYKKNSFDNKRRQSYYQCLRNKHNKILGNKRVTDLISKTVNNISTEE